ncbi:MAG TPA: isochorismatase family cysteine hydrolase [Terriglobales bacterium]|nr:isochorismatase family cysteine hydrolase [Terriglobales bacterium]
MSERRFSEQEVAALAREAYERGEATFPLRRERAALLMIDMQEEFVRPGWTCYWVPEATRRVPVMKRLLEGCRALGVPVIHTLFSRPHGHLDRPRTGAAMPNRYPGIAADPAWFRDSRIIDELGPRPEEIVLRKPSYGAFYDTPLQTILTNLGRDTIVVAGTLTNYCCGATARQGYERGFRVFVVDDATATDDPAAHEAELRVLRRGFARVLSTDQALAELRDGAPAGR